jgi:hypothetical protein
MPMSLPKRVVPWCSESAPSSGILLYILPPLALRYLKSPDIAESLRPSIESFSFDKMTAAQLCFGMFVFRKVGTKYSCQPRALHNPNDVAVS